jgi:hypothetical protein
VNNDKVYLAHLRRKDGSIVTAESHELRKDCIAAIDKVTGRVATHSPKDVAEMTRTLYLNTTREYSPEQVRYLLLNDPFLHAIYQMGRADGAEDARRAG